MAVYTEVSFDEAAALIDGLGIGALQALAPCAGGIENTNYFADTASGRYVLTVFERLGADELPFYLQLMKHLADHALPVPRPHARGDGSLLLALKGKPAAVVDRLPGEHHLAPDAADCASVGRVLARMHLATRDFLPAQPNLRGLDWWNTTVPVVLGHLDPAAAAMMADELAYQRHLASAPAYATLPRGAIHGDLFRDNVMFAGRRASPACSTSISPASTHCSSTSPSPSTTGASTSPRASSTKTAPRRWSPPTRRCVRSKAPRSACCRR